MTDEQLHALVARLRAMADHPWNEHGPSETLRSATDAIEALLTERDEAREAVSFLRVLSNATTAHYEGVEARAERAEAALREALYDLEAFSRENNGPVDMSDHRAILAHIEKETDRD